MIFWLIETLLAVTLLMIMVLALRGPVARSFGAGWAYALWAVPALRLVLPPLPQLAPDFQFPPVVNFIPTAAEMAAPLPVEAGPGQWMPFMLALWAGGAVIFLTMQWLAYRAFLGRLNETSRPARPPLFGGIRTWISEAVEGPMALGFIERRIVLPSDFSRRYNPVERRLALEHELVHHRRGDIWWNMAAMIVLALFWFNPVAWAAFRAFRSDQELACDAAVARKASIEERSDYARALVKSASRPGLIAACALNPADQLKQRLRMMRGHRASPARSAGGVAALGAFATLGFALGSPAVTDQLPAPLRMAAAPAAPAALLSPVAPAPAAEPVEEAAIVVTGQRLAKAARPFRARLKSPPLAIASAEAPLLARMVELPSLMPQMRRALTAPRPGPAHAFAVTPGPQLQPIRVRLSEARTIRIVRSDGTSSELRLIEQTSGGEGPEMERAVAAAIAHASTAEERAALEALRTKAKGLGASGGSGNLFEIDIQTIHQGE